MIKSNKYFSYEADGCDVKNAYHYTECGLDDIYLVNGFTREEIDGDEIVSIHDIDALHVAIGLKIAAASPKLKPNEVKFLRKQLGLTQTQLAQKLKLEAQAVGRYERGEIDEIPGPVDLALRFTYVISVMPKEILEKLLHKINEHNEISACPEGHYFNYSEHEWDGGLAA